MLIIAQEGSPSKDLLPDDLVDREFRHRFLEPCVLRLKLAHPFRLVNSQAVVGLAPAKIRLFGHAQ